MTSYANHQYIGVYRPYHNPRTIICWYCTECCSVFVGFYVGNCLLKCPVLYWQQSHPGFMVSRAHYSGNDSLYIHQGAYYGQDKLQAIPQPQNHYILVWYTVLFCFCRFLCGQLPVEVSSPLLAAKSPRLHGEQSPLFWEQFTKHSLECIL